MFSYFMLRTEQQLFCYLYGGALALSLQLLFSPSFPGNGFILVSLPVALFWAGLALYTRHIDQMRKPDVSPLVSIRDGIQVVAMLPRHEKARLEWKILQDDEVYRRQMHALLNLMQRISVCAGSDTGGRWRACLGGSAGRCPAGDRPAEYVPRRAYASDRLHPSLCADDFCHIGPDSRHCGRSGSAKCLPARVAGSVAGRGLAYPQRDRTMRRLRSKHIGKNMSTKEEATWQRY